MQIGEIVHNILEIKSVDPDDARRRKLLNILLLGATSLAALGILVAFVNALFHLWPSADINFIFIASVGALIGGIGTYLINRKSGSLAALFFLTLLTVSLVFSDTPKEVADGRSLFVFSIPIVAASLLLTPSASFLFAGISSLIIATISISISEFPNIPAMMGYFLLATISWLSSRSLEQALKELRVLNRDLDRRVEVRTRELSEALRRELIEAGKTQAILQGIADGVLVFDQSNKIILANPSMGTLAGTRPNKLLGLDIQALCQHKGIAPEDRSRLQKLLESPSSNTQAVRVRWNEKTLSVNAAPVISGLGEIFGLVAVFRDFTREAEIEQMKNNFVAMVSHELRTPLNVILAYAEMLRDAIFGPLSTKQFDAANRIYLNSQRLLNIINDLLDQAQIEAGRLKIQPNETPTNELIENLRSVMEKPAQDKGLELTTEIAPDVPETILCDSHRIQQILINLVNNALKFTDEGRVSVRIFLADAHTWAIAVSDTGPGIPPDDRARIFEPFWQIENIATREHGGIGLGLSIVKRLAMLMGGNIELESAGGKGSTFIVKLPLHPVLERQEKK